MEGKSKILYLLGGEPSINFDSVSYKAARHDMKRLQVLPKSVATQCKKVSGKVYKATWKPPGWKWSFDNY